MADRQADIEMERTPRTTIKVSSLRTLNKHTHLQKVHLTLAMYNNNNNNNNNNDDDDDDDMIIIIIIIRIIRIIIIIAFKGANRDFLQSPHCAAKRLQHVRSSVPSAIVCKSRATHRALITCNVSYSLQSKHQHVAGT